MANGSNAARAEARALEKGELTAAREELEVLDTLSEGVSAKIAEFSRRPQFQGKVDNIEVSLQEHKYARLKAYEELARVCYGRTVVGTEVDIDERPLRGFTYRITQANVGHIDGGCAVLARNSPLATALVTAQPGDGRDVTVNNKDRFLNVAEVRLFDGPTSLRSTQPPNFRSMAVQTIGAKRPAVVEDLRSYVHRLTATEVIEEEPVPQSATPPGDLDAAWLNNWSGVYLGEAEELSLGHHFFTRTTVKQETALNNPRGLTFVEGIAGAGKTSVALGRLKFFANFATGAERESYGLQGALEKDFSPDGMVGFVLSHSLKRYLKETAYALGLEHLPIRDFEEFRTELSSRFGITDNFRRKKDEASLRSGVNWLRAVDAAMARAAGSKLRENLTSAKDVPEVVATDVLRIVNDLMQAEPHRDSRTFNVHGLIVRIVGAVADAELRHRETVVNQEFKPKGKPGTPEYQRAVSSHEREMRRVQQEFEKRIVSPLGLSLLSGLTSHELILTAVSLDVFPTLVRQSFGHTSNSVVVVHIDNTVDQIRRLLLDGGARPILTDTDIVTLIILAAMIADGFDYVDPRGATKSLYQMRRNTAVFIDEVQDFTEVEVLLMGLAVTSNYNQVTLSGDRCQRLQSAGAQSYDYLFPLIPRNQNNKPIFLDQNFRQRSELATLSLAFRELVQGDRKIDFEPAKSGANSGADCISIYKYESRERMSDFILRRVRSIPHNATIAVIAPSSREAQDWFDLLQEELGAYHRTALMSRRDDLTRRFNVHFTEVRETKGLEFDVVIVPDIGSFALGTDIGRNQAYVAISRARHALVLGCTTDGVAKPEIEKLRQSNVVCIRDLPAPH